MQIGYPDDGLVPKAMGDARVKVFAQIKIESDHDTDVPLRIRCNWSIDSWLSLQSAGKRVS